MILKELYRTEQDGVTLVAIGNGSNKIAKKAREGLQSEFAFWAIYDNFFLHGHDGHDKLQFYALELSDFEKFNAIGEAESQAAEKSKVYWSKPSHFPPICWVRQKDWDYCRIHTHICDGGLEDDLTKHMRWSDRPFDHWEDGKECLVEE